MEVRNGAFRKGILKSVSFDVPIISVGNLSVGGTGKTPMVKHLIKLYSPTKQIGVLSRGYGRLTKGFLEVNTTSLAKNVGDEPLEIKTQFPQITVTVCENRVLGIPEMLAINTNIDLIILDDAFQHQYVKPTFSVLLTTFSEPFTSDYLLPMGRLREFRHNVNRADAIVITKSPDLKHESVIAGLPTFYSKIQYDALKTMFGKERSITKPIIVSGLADNTQFQEDMKKTYPDCILSGFSDHQTYSVTEVKQMIYDADRLDNNIITTEKDWVKLKTFVLELKPDVTFWVQSLTLGFAKPEVLKDLIDTKIDGKTRQS